MSDLMSSKKQLEGSLALLQGTLDATDDGFLVLDVEGKVIKFNHRLLEIFSLQPETSVDDVVGS